MLDIVYFVQAGRHIKIGKSTLDGLHTRLATLQANNPYDIKLLGFLFGGVEIESEMHELFRGHHFSREWFNAHQDIVDFLESGTAKRNAFEYEYSFAINVLKLDHSNSIKYANKKCLTSCSMSDSVKVDTNAQNSIVHMLGKKDSMSARDLRKGSRVFRKLNEEDQLSLLESMVSNGIIQVSRNNRVNRRLFSLTKK